MRTQYIRLLHLYGEKLGNGVSGTTADITVLERDKSGKISRATGLDVPVDTTAGYAKGCVFIDTNVVAGTSGRYTNVGTTASCNFDLEGTFSGDSSMAEIDRACDLSARLVSLTATASITLLLHDGKDLYVTGTDAMAFTLPEATGTGARLRFIIGEVSTAGTTIVVADTTNANFIGNVINQDADLVGTIAALIYPAPANADTITLNGTTTGGQLGDYIELIDVATDVWFVNGVVSCPAGSNTASCFSAAV